MSTGHEFVRRAPHRALSVAYIFWAAAGTLLATVLASAEAPAAELLATRLRRQQLAADEQRPAATTPSAAAVPSPASDTGCVDLASLGYRLKAITEIRVDLTVHDRRLPPDCSTEIFHTDSASTGRNWPLTEFQWEASELYAQPAYFDDPILERYGQSRHPLIQPWFSGAHFFAQFPLMPYKFGLDRTHDHVYVLGYHRPGSPTPSLRRHLPWEADAAGFEGLTWTALLLALP